MTSIVRAEIAATVRRLCLIASVMGATAMPSFAQEAVQVSIGYAGQRFEPAETSAPADRPLMVRVRNSGSKAIEFESKSLRVEKVIAPGTEGVMNIRPLKPGRYEYFDDFDPAVRGAIVVK